MSQNINLFHFSQFNFDFLVHSICDLQYLSCNELRQNYFSCKVKEGSYLSDLWKIKKNSNSQGRYLKIKKIEELTFNNKCSQFFVDNNIFGIVPDYPSITDENTFLG